MSTDNKRVVRDGHTGGVINPSVLTKPELLTEYKDLHQAMRNLHDEIKEIFEDYRDQMCQETREEIATRLQASGIEVQPEKYVAVVFKVNPEEVEDLYELSQVIDDDLNARIALRDLGLTVAEDFPARYKSWEVNERGEMK